MLVESPRMGHLLVHLALLLLSLQLVICAEDYYEVLGISREASDRQIKSAYRSLSKKYHPDKNLNDESAKDRFVEVAAAYEALIDPESRRLYDKYGHDGLQRRKQSGGGAGGDPFDLFSRFFGGDGHFGQDARQRRGPSIEHKVAFPLRDFYTGTTVELRWDRQQVCDVCHGTGSADGQTHACAVCGGRGVRIHQQQIAPGFIQQIQATCESCGGRGRAIKHVCPACQGRRVVKRPTTVPVTVPPGAAKGQRLVFENEADASPDYIAGDFIVTLMEKEPEKEVGGGDNAERVDGYYFWRKDDHLFWHEVLSLREAWMGDWTRNLTHLDGHLVQLGRKAGQVVQPGHVDTIEGEGMPKYHEDYESVYHKMEYGNLYVEYSVVLPDQMDQGMEAEFRALWETWRQRAGVDLHKDSGRPDRTEDAPAHEEL